MPLHNIDKMLHRIEENAEDELSFLLSTGVEFFSTAQLLRLKGQWEVKNTLFHRLYGIWMKIGACIPFFLAIWLLFDTLEMDAIQLAFFFAFLFTLFCFLGGMLMMRYLFPGNGHLDMVGELIKVELGRRRFEE